MATASQEVVYYYAISNEVRRPIFSEARVVLRRKNTTDAGPKSIALGGTFAFRSAFTRRRMPVRLRSGGVAYTMSHRLLILLTGTRLG
jgi:hypothetical protein